MKAPLIWRLRSPKCRRTDRSKRQRRLKDSITMTDFRPAPLLIKSGTGQC